MGKPTVTFTKRMWDDTSEQKVFWESDDYKTPPPESMDLDKPPPTPKKHLPWKYDGNELTGIKIQLFELN